MIRPAEPADIPHLIRIIKDAFASYELVMDPEYEVPDFLSLRQTYDFRRKHLLTALWDGEIAGCGALTIEGKTAWLSRIYVHARFRKKGIGTNIIEQLIGIARQYRSDDSRFSGGPKDRSAVKSMPDSVQDPSRPSSTVELWSDTRFTDAHRLYLRLGFRQSGRERVLPNDPNYTVEYHFIRNL